MGKLKLNRGAWYYADPEEVAAWLHGWKRQYALDALLTRHFPRHHITLDAPWDDVEAFTDAIRDHDAALFQREPIQSQGLSINQLAMYNPNLLDVGIPRATPTGIVPGHIWSSSKDPASVQVWRSILQEFELRTEAGVWYTAERQSRPFFAPEVRYTLGAAALLTQGYKLLDASESWVSQLGREPKKGGASRCM